LTSAGVVLPSGQVSAKGQPRWVVSRSLCRFKHFSLPAVPSAQRRAVLRNLLLAWAPFDDADYCVVSRGDVAFAWAWDRSRAAAALAETASSGTVNFVPEALVYSPAAADSVRLVQALEGVDAQVWRGGALRASHWWPVLPTAAEWTRWLRTAAGDGPQDPDSRVPAVQSLAWQQPWAEGVALDDLLASVSRLERVALGAAVVGLVALSSAQLRQGWAAVAERRDLAAERDRLAAQAAPVVLARDRALVLAAEIGLLSAQLSAPAPLEVMQHLAERLPAAGVVLKELELGGTRLRIGLDVAPTLARTALVRDLQAGGWFAQVNEVRDVSGRGWIGLEMQVQGLRPPATNPTPVLPGNAPLPQGPAGAFPNPFSNAPAAGLPRP